MVITSRFPTATVDDQLMVMVLGPSEALFGDQVNVQDMFRKERYEGYYVVGIDSVPATKLEDSVLEAFGIGTVEQLVSGLSQSYGTGLPLAVPVTVYTLSENPPPEEEEEEYFEVEEYDPDEFSGTSETGWEYDDGELLIEE